MHIAALVKQVPTLEQMELGPDGRLRRAGVELEMNPYCRRAVAYAVELAGLPGSTVAVFTLGPPSAEDTLREAIAWGLARGVPVTGVHLCDPAFAGSDTLATAKVLAAALRTGGRFDLILAGKNSVDADTGQVGPELAELLDLPFVGGVRELDLEGDRVRARAEHDDGYTRVELRLPALLSCAERLCEPAKVEPDGRASVPAELISRLGAADLAPGPWGQAASPTRVGSVRIVETDRLRHCLPSAAPAEQAREAVRLLVERGAFDATRDHAIPVGKVPPRTPRPDTAATVAVVAEPGRDNLTAELLGVAALIAAELEGRTIAFTVGAADASRLGAAGADNAVELHGAKTPEDVAAAVAAAALDTTPWAILAPSTTWGREVAGRTAARLGAGLTGDALGLEVAQGRLVAWKPAFGGRLVAAVTASSPVQMATVRPGVLPRLAPRDGVATVSTRAVAPRSRLTLLEEVRDDDIDLLAEAAVVVGVGQGVDPSEYGLLHPLMLLLGAELGATRKVTDRGWLPRARQIGITGRTITPRLFISVGAAGKFNHTVGVRTAGTILAINAAADAPIFEQADAGIVGDWREVLPLLMAELEGVPVRTGRT